MCIESTCLNALLKVIEPYHSVPDGEQYTIIEQIVATAPPARSTVCATAPTTIRPTRPLRRALEPCPAILGCPALAQHLEKRISTLSWQWD